MSLSPKNRALAERLGFVELLVDSRQTSTAVGFRTLNALLDAAREEGLDQGRDESAEPAAGEDI